MKKVAVIMGSDSDLPVVKGAITRLKQFDVPFEVHVMSAHRTPAAAESFARTAEEQGFGVIIAAAGKAAPDLARNLQGAGKYGVYDEIMDAVADFDMVNAKLDAILSKLMAEEF